jgi:hypothetical protein
VYADSLLVEKLTNRWVWLWASVLLYLACLPLPGLCVNHNCGELGIEIVAIGWLGLRFINPSNPVPAAWLANPFLLVSWIIIVWQRPTIIARILSGAALLAGALLLFADTIVPSIEGSGDDHVTGYPLGYWLWVTSMLCAFIAAMLTREKGTVGSRGQRKRQENVSMVQYYCGTCHNPIDEADRTCERCGAPTRDRLAY